MIIDDKKEVLLKDLGLTQNEIKVYVNLYELGESKTGKICDKTGIPSSNIYHILDSLHNKGLVNYKVIKNIKYYYVSSPNIFKELLKDKIQNLQAHTSIVDSLIDDFKKVTNREEEFHSYKYFEGIRSIKAMWLEINDYMDKNYVFKVHTAKKESYNVLVGFYTEHHKTREIKGIKELMIFPKEDIKLAKQ